MKTQIITLEKLEKFLNTRDRKVISIVPHIVDIIKTDSVNMKILKSVLVVYKEI